MPKHPALLHLACLLVAALSAGVSPADAGKFRRDDPLWEDPDRLSIPQPTARPLSKTLDLLQKTFLEPAGSQHAVNINTLGEVPDSSWFTNRMSRRVLTPEELKQGPDRGDGPDLSQPWTIIRAKGEGITPGFRIRDARGVIYFIKLDPLDWPQMATSAEVIATKFFHACGYNTPENYLLIWSGAFTVDGRANVVWSTGHKEPLTVGYIKALLARAPRRPDGSMQVLASRMLPGKPLGPFDYQGVRADDPNDIHHHQDRRELRGLRLFAAWLNHNDSDSVNSLDMYHTDEAGRSWVKHYLIDFGTTLGSGATQPHARRVGHEYYLEAKPALKAALTLGIWDRPWRHVTSPLFPGVGRFESRSFQPDRWKPDYPNPAFDRMTLEDAFWATRTLMRFDDTLIRAVVQTGRITDPAAEEYLVATLIQRRDLIVRHYLSQVNPLDRFEIAASATGPYLAFVNLGLEAGLATQCRYRYQWFRFDNETESRSPLVAAKMTSSARLPLPDPGATFLTLRVSSYCEGQPAWSSAIEVAVRNGDVPQIVGVERGTSGRFQELSE